MGDGWAESHEVNWTPNETQQAISWSLCRVEELVYMWIIEHVSRADPHKYEELSQHELVVEELCRIDYLKFSKFRCSRMKKRIFLWLSRKYDIARKVRSGTCGIQG